MTLEWLTKLNDENAAQILQLQPSSSKMAKHELQACLWGDPTRKSRRFAPYLERITFLGSGLNDVIFNDGKLGTNIISGASVMVDRRNTCTL